MHAGEVISAARWRFAAGFVGVTAAAVSGLRRDGFACAEVSKKENGMQSGHVYLAAQQDAQRSVAALNELAKMRGEAYLEDARKYLSRRDYRNARATAVE